jgi:hypothetical protein
MRYAPDPVRSADVDAVDQFARYFGVQLLPWQTAIVADSVATDPATGAVASQLVVIAPRRNGKTHLAAIRLLWALIVDGVNVVYTAHLGDTARATFDAVVDMIAASDFAGMVARVARGKGDERVILTTGAQLLVRTRTTAGGRGLGCGLLVIDEALEATADHIAALTPLLATEAAAGRGQLVVLSSAGHGRSTVLAGIRDRGRATPAPNIRYWEFGAADTDDVDNRAVWVDANPSLDTPLLSRAFLESQRAVMSAADFGREHLGQWVADTGRLLLPRGSFAAGATAAPPTPDTVTGRPVIGVEVMAGRLVAVAAVDLVDGAIWVEVVADVAAADTAAAVDTVDALRRRLRPAAIVTSSDTGRALIAASP